jgi:hypothetical protein
MKKVLVVAVVVAALVWGVVSQGATVGDRS